MSPEEELLKRLYERFNARDLESALAAMQEERQISSQQGHEDHKD